MMVMVVMMVMMVMMVMVVPVEKRSLGEDFLHLMSEFCAALPRSA